MKRLLTLALALALVLSLCTGISVAEEPRVLTVAARTGRADGFESDVFKEIEKRLNIKFETHEFDDDTFAAMLSSNDLYDIVLSDDFLPQVLESGLALDVTPYIDEYAPNLKSAAAAPIMEASRDLVSNGEGLYIMPAPAGMHNVTIGGMGQRVVRGYVVRFDYYEEIGMPEIHNDDDYIAALQKMLELHPTTEDGQKCYLYGVRNNKMDGYMRAFRSDIAVNPWSNYQYKSSNFTNDVIDGYLDVEKSPFWAEMEFLNKIYRLGGFDMDCFTMTGDEFSAKCRDGVYMGLYENFGELLSEASKTDPETHSAYLVVPSDGMMNYSNVDMILGNMPGNFTFIWKDSKNIDIAMQVYNLMYDLDFMRWVYSGEQGRDWDYDENGVPHMTAETMAYRAEGTGEDTFWKGTASHGNRWWFMFGYNPATLHTDGYPLDLTFDRDIAISGQTHQAKIICDAYGVEYFADAYLIEKDYRNDLGEPISSCMKVSTADQRILATCDAILAEATATMIMSETVEEFEANRAAYLEELEETGEPEVFERYKVQWDAAKEVMNAKNIGVLEANGLEMYPVD